MTDYDRSLGHARRAARRDDRGRHRRRRPVPPRRAGTRADRRPRHPGTGGSTERSIVVMTREAADVHVRPGAAADRVTYGASFSLTLDRGRTVTGVVRDKASGGPVRRLGRPRGAGDRRAGDGRISGRHRRARPVRPQGTLARPRGAVLLEAPRHGPVGAGTGRPGRAEAGPALLPRQGPRERSGRGRRGLPAGHPVPT